MANIKETIASLKRVNEVLKTEKEYSGAIVECSRMLLSEEEIHEVQSLSLEAGALIASIETNYGSYSRIAPYSKKFAVQK